MTINTCDECGEELTGVHVRMQSKSRDDGSLIEESVLCVPCGEMLQAMLEMAAGEKGRKTEGPTVAEMAEMHELEEKVCVLAAECSEPGAAISVPDAMRMACEDGTTAGYAFIAKAVLQNRTRYLPAIAIWNGEGFSLRMGLPGGGTYPPEIPDDLSGLF